MGTNGVGGSLGYTPRKMIKPVSYNGVRSTGFKGVQVFQSNTVINRTVVVNDGYNVSGGCSSHKSGGGFWNKLAGILTGGALGVGLVGALGGLFGKKDKGAPEKTGDAPAPTTQRVPEKKQPAEDDKLYYGGQLPEFVVTAKAKDPSKVKDFYSNVKATVEEEVKDLAGMYQGIVQGLEADKLADGTYSVKMTVNSVMSAGGKSVDFTGTVKTPQEFNEWFNNNLNSLYDVKDNPFAKKDGEE